MSDETEAAKVALERKPRGKQARAFYKYIETLVSECVALQEIEGQKARNRQIAIGKEIALYKFPAVVDNGEYCTAQDAGEWQYLVDFNGRYYPEWKRQEEIDLTVKDMLTDDCARGEITVEQLAEKTNITIEEAQTITDKAKKLHARIADGKEPFHNELKNKLRDFEDDIPF